jgi:hypothetical protein
MIGPWRYGNPVSLAKIGRIWRTPKVQIIWVMNLIDRFDSCLRGEANGLGMEWPFEKTAQIFSKLWERRRQAELLLWRRQAAVKELGKEDIAC